MTINYASCSEGIFGKHVESLKKWKMHKQFTIMLFYISAQRLMIDIVLEVTEWMLKRMHS